MAIATLSTIAAQYFSGGAHLATGELRTLLNLQIAKINEVIAGVPESGGHASFATLDVGMTAYYGTNESWMRIDGVNPPGFSSIRLLDTVTATMRLVQSVNGVLTVT